MDQSLAGRREAWLTIVGVGMEASEGASATVVPVSAATVIGLVVGGPIWVIAIGVGSITLVRGSDAASHVSA